MLYKITEYCICFVLTFGSIGSVHAQSTEQPQNPSGIPFTLDLGGAIHRFGLSLNLSYPMSYQTLSFEFLYLTDVLFPFGEAPQGNADKDIEYSLLYGVRTEGSVGIASISSGVSLVKSVYGEFAVERVVALGIPVRLQVILKTGRDTGIGLTYFANINNHDRYSGGLLSLRRVFH